MAQQTPLRWPKEPLVYFLFAGALVFFLNGFVDSSAESYQIEMTESDLQRLADQWEAQMGRPVNQSELAGLKEQWIREEIFYREAMRLGLEEHDVIIRRRLVQKLTFLTEDIATSVPPTQEELRSFYGDNLARYTDPDRYSFSHRYFSAERREDAKADAQASLADPEITGDPFMLQNTYAERSLREVGDLFGREFAESVAQLPIGKWTGPVRSAYGWHLVNVKKHTPSAPQNLADVSIRVANDVQLSRRQAANRRFYEDLQQRYEILTP